MNISKSEISKIDKKLKDETPILKFYLFKNILPLDITRDIGGFSIWMFNMGWII